MLKMIKKRKDLLVKHMSKTETENDKLNAKKIDGKWEAQKDCFAQWQENFFRTILKRYPGDNILMRTFKEIWRYKHDMD